MWLYWAQNMRISALNGTFLGENAWNFNEKDFQQFLILKHYINLHRCDKQKWNKKLFFWHNYILLHWLISIGQIIIWFSYSLHFITALFLLMSSDYWHQVWSHGSKNMAVSVLFSRLTEFDPTGCDNTNKLDYTALSNVDNEKC